MTDTTVRKEDRKYNILGTATKIAIVEARQGRFARLTIDRGAKGLLKAKMKDKALAKFEGLGFGEGSQVDFYGFYEKGTWTGQDGKLRTTDTFVVLSVSAPKTADEIAALKAAKAARTRGQTPAETAPATTDEEIPF